MTDIIEIIRKEIGRDPKVIGYAVFSSEGEVNYLARIDEDYLKDIVASSLTIGKYINYGFFHCGDERLMILKLEGYYVAVLFNGDVRIGYLMLLSSRLKATIIQNAAGLEIPKKLVMPKVSAAEATVTFAPQDKGQKDIDLTKIKDVKVKKPKSKEPSPVVPVKTQAPEGQVQPLSFIPPPPVPVNDFITSKESEGSKIELAPPPPGAKTSDLTQKEPAKPKVSKPVQEALEITAKGTVVEKSPPREVKAEPAVLTGMPADFETGMNKIPVPTQNFADLWDDFPTSPLNNKFGEIALDVLSQVDGIGNLNTINERLPHLSGVQVYQIMTEALKIGYVALKE
ncbi:MAG: hypothetical protein ACTSUV_05120 [Candidatus Ranarchaeia archaeon]